MNKERFIEELRKMSSSDRRDLINTLRNRAAELDAAEEENQWKTFGNLAGELDSRFEKYINKPTGFENKAAAKEIMDSIGIATGKLGDALGIEIKKEESDSSDKSEDDTKQEQEETSNEPSYDVDEMAGEFILGAWGNGQDRIDNMLNAGYTLDDYNKIQQRVNEAYASGRDLHEWTNKANEELHYW